MPDVNLKPLNETVPAEINEILLDVLLRKECQVMMACGRQGICATCHIYINGGADSLSKKSVREEKTLALITGANEHSRLSCQCTIIGNGPIDVLLPEGLYVESFDDLEALVGKRTQVPILHPLDGSVLIQKGKIITRTMIMKLADTNFDPHSVMTDAADPRNAMM